MPLFAAAASASFTRLRGPLGPGALSFPPAGLSAPYSFAFPGTVNQSETVPSTV